MVGVHVARAIRLIAVLAACGLSASSPTGTWRQPARSADAAAIQSWIDGEFAATRAPSLTVAVGQNGRLLWARSWGYADKAREIRATPQTLYSLASVSKSITATALMTLVDQGRIDLDAPIEQYLGGLHVGPYAGAARDATVRRIAHHVSGLPMYQNFFYDDEDRRLQSIPEAIRRYGILVRPPGVTFAYSNLGYAILGHAIAGVSGRPFESYLQREVFEPLGMTHSAIAIPAALTNQTAVRYALDGTALPHYDPDTTGASSIYASAEDLVRFGFLHVKALAPGQRAILRDPTIDLMQRRAPPSPFGIGWLVLEGKDAGVAFHGGGMDGVSTALFIVPGERLVVAGLSSTMVDLPGRVAAGIVNRMTGRDIDLNRDPPFPRQQRGTMPPSLVGEWRGEVLAHNGSHAFALTIDASGALQAQLDAGERRPAESVEWMGDELYGSIVADLGVTDVRQPYRLRFQLHLAAPNQLEGPLNAWSFRRGRGADIVPSFVRVRRTSPTP